MKRELKTFDNPRNVKALRRFLYGVVLVLVIVDPFVHKHPDFPWEGVPGFYAVYGFIAYVLLINIAKKLRPLIKRREDYYE